MAFKDQTIWIIGASSGIGESLARILNEHGASLILSARNEDKLNAFNEDLNDQHMVLPFDIADFKETQNAVAHVKSSGKPIDRIICMAGIYEPSAIKNISDKNLTKIIAVNLTGIMHFAKCAYNLVEKQNKAQIALCASVIGYIGLPNAQPYAASKAGLINFIQSLRMEADKHVDIKMINPGFVRTPLTDKNEFSMPFILEPEDAAQRILKGLQSNAFDINFPKRLTLTLKLISILPDFLKIPICSKFK